MPFSVAFFVVQELLLKEGVLAYVIPLLLGYDTTLEEKEGGQPAFNAEMDSSQIGPQFLGLGFERSNMQACPNCPFEALSLAYIGSPWHIFPCWVQHSLLKCSSASDHLCSIHNENMHLS